MARKHATPPTDTPLDGLRRRKSERLVELLKAKPGQKHYKRALRAYLDVDGDLQTALLRRAADAAAARA